MAGSLTVLAPSAVAVYTTGRLAGVVRDDAGHGVRNAPLEFINVRGVVVAHARARVDGTWQSPPLNVLRAYYICAEVSSVMTDRAPYGYQNQCWDHVAQPAYLSRYNLRPLATVTPTADTTTGGIDFDVSRLATFKGTIRFADATTSDVNATVTLFDPTSGAPVATDRVDHRGHYDVGPLVPGAYDVCWSAQTTQPYTPQCSRGQVWTPYYQTRYDTAPPPPGTTPVTLAPGQTRQLSPTLQVGSDIAGVVTAARSHARLQGVAVSVYSGTGRVQWTGVTGVDGSYRSGPLAQSGVGYRVCFDAGHQTHPGRYGQQNACYGGAYWNGVDVPQLGKRVRVGARVDVTGIDAALPDGGVIEGALDYTYSEYYPVKISLFRSDSTLVKRVNYQPRRGRYHLKGVPRDPDGYTVCVSSSYDTDAPYCYGGVPWTGGALPASVTPVPVHVHGITEDIDLTAHQTGAYFEGQISTGGRPTGATVVAFDQSGVKVTSLEITPTGGAYWGMYGFLPGATYTVCFVPTYRLLAPQCYRDVPWDGSSEVPPGATTVTATRAPHNVDHLDADLVPVAG